MFVEIQKPTPTYYFCRDRSRLVSNLVVKQKGLILLNAKCVERNVPVGIGTRCSIDTWKPITMTGQCPALIALIDLLIILSWLGTYQSPMLISGCRRNSQSPKNYPSSSIPSNPFPLNFAVASLRVRFVCVVT